MPYALYATGAALILSMIGILVQTARASVWRELALDRADEIAELKTERKSLELRNAKLLTELTDFRAEKARRMAPLIKANAECKAKAANKAA